MSVRPEGSWKRRCVGRVEGGGGEVVGKWRYA